MTCPSFAIASQRQEEAADLSASKSQRATIDAGWATWQARVDVGRIERTILADLRRRIRCRSCPDWTKTGTRTATPAWRRTKAAGVGAVDNGVGTQQPIIDGSVEGGRSAAFKTSTTRRIAPPPLLLPLPGMHIQAIGKGGGRGGFEVEDGCRRLTSSCACDNAT